MSWLYKVIKNSQISYDTRKPYFVGFTGANFNRITNLAIDETVVKDLISNTIKQKVLELKMQEADAVLGKAKEAAKEIIEKAQMESDNIMKSKEQEGFKNGIEMANMKYLKAIKNMEDLEKKLKAEYEEKLNCIKEQILDLAIILVKRIIDIEIDKNDNAILSALKAVMDKVEMDDVETVEMSPVNVYKINKLQPQHDYKLEANDELGQLDMILNTKSGIIDVSLDSQFENLKNSLYEIRATL